MIPTGKTPATIVTVMIVTAMIITGAPVTGTDEAAVRPALAAA